MINPSWVWFTDTNVFAVTYLASGGAVKDVLYGHVKCDRFGKRLAFTNVVFTNAEEQVVARGSHTKYFISISIPVSFLQV